MNAEKKYYWILVFILMIVVSFSLGMEVQHQITMDAVEKDTVGDIFIMQHEVSNILRSIDNGRTPAELDIIVLRNCSANIVDTLNLENIRNISEYPNSISYLKHFNNELLMVNADISACVQQYGRLLCEIQIDREKGLYELLNSLENHLLVIPVLPIEAAKETGESPTVQSLVYEYAEAVTSKDIDQYIELFTLENQRSMYEYVSEFGQKDFFHEEDIEITNIRELSTNTGKRSAGLSIDEVSAYEDLAVYYAEMSVNGSQKEYKTFILVKENNKWKILRVSTPDLQAISSAGEDFKTQSERSQSEEQENLKITLLEESLDHNQQRLCG